MSILYRYLIVIIACTSMLVGLQVPSFVDQYQKRLDAHLREVSANLMPFQQIADKYLSGDLAKLIELNRNSGSKPLVEEGTAIAQMATRKLRFESELEALQASLPMQALHILLDADQEILAETRAQFTRSVPLDGDALTFAAIFTLIMLMAIELLFALSRHLWPRLSTGVHRPPTRPGTP